MTYIVVTNDDGVHAPGLLALTEALRTIADVEVIAPAINQSASGHKKTLAQPMRVEQTTLADGTRAAAVSGSPADCIALAALGMIKWPPRFVVSGINRGANMGQDITYSGTVTAALEATLHGVPALAVSLNKRDADTVADYEVAAEMALNVVKMIMHRVLPAFTILNLNVPYGSVKGVRVARQGVRIYQDELERDGELCKIVGPEPGGILDEEGTDLWAVHNGYASLTPIHLDMTAHKFMADVAAWAVDLAAVDAQPSLVGK